MIILLEGADGTGKTTLAEALCKRTGALYLHATYRFKKKIFTYHTALLRMAIRYIRDTGRPVVMDRLWLSEAVYARAYRGGSPWPLAGRFMERVLNKVGGVIIFCLHDGTDDEYRKRYEALKATRREMFAEADAAAALYRGLWDGTTQKKNYPDYALRRDYAGDPRCFRYSIGEEGRDLDGFITMINDKITGCPLLYADNLAGGFITSRVLMVGDELAPGRRGREWAVPFYKYENSSRYLTAALDELNVAEAGLAWVNANDSTGPSVMELWLRTRRPYERRVVVLGRRAEKTFTRFFPNQPYSYVPHPQAPARFPRYRDGFKKALRDAFFELKGIHK